MKENIKEILNNLIQQLIEGNITLEEAIKEILNVIEEKEKEIKENKKEENKKREKEKQQQENEENNEEDDSDIEEEKYSHEIVRVERWLAPIEEKDYILKNIKPEITIEHIDKAQGATLYDYVIKEDGVYAILYLPKELEEKYKYLSPSYIKDNEDKVLVEIALTNNPKRKNEKVFSYFSEKLNLLPKELKQYIMFKNNKILVEALNTKTKDSVINKNYEPEWIQDLRNFIKENLK